MAKYDIPLCINNNNLVTIRGQKGLCGSCEVQHHILHGPWEEPHLCLRRTVDVQTSALVAASEVACEPALAPLGPGPGVLPRALLGPGLLLWEGESVRE